MNGNEGRRRKGQVEQKSGERLSAASEKKMILLKWTIIVSYHILQLSTAFKCAAPVDLKPLAVPLMRPRMPLYPLR